MMKKIIFLLIAFSTTSLWAQNAVFSAKESPAIKKFTGSDCFYYMLPQTALHVKVTVAKTKEMQGYYGEYAEKLLGLTNIITSNKTSYKLKEIHIFPFAIPDTNHLYVVQMSENQIKSRFLESIYKQETPPLLNDDYTVITSSIPDFFRNYADLAYIETDDSFLETRIIDGVVTQIPVNKTKMVSKTMAQQAQEAADFIAQIRQDRYDLLTGTHEVPYSKEAIEYMVEQLNLLEQNYLSLFTGFTIEEDEVHSFWITPDEGSNLPVFSIDPDEGFSKTLSSKKEFNFYLSIIPFAANQTLSDFKSRNSSKKKEKINGYRIRPAAPCEISLLKNTTQSHSFGIIPIYQKGMISILPTGMDHFNITDFVIIH